MSDSFPTSALIRPRHSQTQTQTHWQKHNAYRKQKMMHSNRPLFGRLVLLGMLAVLALLLTGCATNSTPPPAVCPVLPAMPPATTPQPQTTYSDNVRLQLQNWRNKLTATHLTP